MSNSPMRSTERQVLGKGIGGPGKPTRLEPRGGLASIEELLTRWLRHSRSAKRASEKSVVRRWTEVVGDEIAAHTRIVKMSAGELVVEVDSASLLNELSTYYRQEILQSIVRFEEFRGIQKLRFRVGVL